MFAIPRHGLRHVVPVAADGDQDAALRQVADVAIGAADKGGKGGGGNWVAGLQSNFPPGSGAAAETCCTAATRSGAAAVAVEGIDRAYQKSGKTIMASFRHLLQPLQFCNGRIVATESIALGRGGGGGGQGGD
jgi:hypothetical protein